MTTTKLNANAEQIEKIGKKAVAYANSKKEDEKCKTPQEYLHGVLRTLVEEADVVYASTWKSKTLEELDESIRRIAEGRWNPDKKEEEEDEFCRDDDGEYVEKTPEKFDMLLSIFMGDSRFHSLWEAQDAKPWVKNEWEVLKSKKFTKDELRTQILDCIGFFEVNRRVRAFYDIQKLRISTTNRSSMYSRIFGIQDVFIDDSAASLERMEAQCQKLIERLILRSCEKPFYEWLINHRGIGPVTAGCIISELGSPERFRTVSSLWAYCGLSVVVEEDGMGHCQRRERGKTANWNSFLKTKLLGVIATNFVKQQTSAMKEGDLESAKNIVVLHGYKNRIVQRNDLIPESHRYYNKNGKELFQISSDDIVRTYDKHGNPKEDIPGYAIPRRSKGHLNNMALRYMIKMFLCDALNEWRRIKGLPRLVPWDEKYLRDGRPHGGFVNAK